MGSIKSGNRKPRERKEVTVKSQLYQFRLHPDNVDEAWLMNVIEHYKAQNIPLRRLALEGIAALEQHPISEHQIYASATDVKTIRDMVQWLVDQAQAGNLGGGGSRGKRIKQAVFEAPEHVREMINHYLDGGISDED